MGQPLVQGEPTHRLPTSCILYLKTIAVNDPDVFTFLFLFTENVAEENLFYIVSPKDLVLAKVCHDDTYEQMNFFVVFKAVCPIFY